ncbi:MAG: hypothetical protein HC908_00130 [Calothrix sp. SM1_7_51]|nr:hypothetical protein [Calothrix sp. SM1_7_51]
MNFIIQTAENPKLKIQNRKTRFIPDGSILALIWIAICIFDISWILLNNAPPGWDQGDHLTRAVNYWGMFQNPDFFDGEWWTKLWRLSPGYRSPFVYLMTIPFFIFIWSKR